MGVPASPPMQTLGYGGATDASAQSANYVSDNNKRQSAIARGENPDKTGGGRRIYTRRKYRKRGCTPSRRRRRRRRSKGGRRITRTRNRRYSRSRRGYKGGSYTVRRSRKKRRRRMRYRGIGGSNSDCIEQNTTSPTVSSSGPPRSAPGQDTQSTSDGLTDTNNKLSTLQDGMRDAGSARGSTDSNLCPT